jgi:DNA-binding MarR family transcriptional regulator
MQGEGPLSSSKHVQEMRVTLDLLNAVSENPSVTQRSLSLDLGIALGLANAYLKRCVKKGYIKISQIQPNRCAYYLTPKGFAEKSRLTARYLSQSFLLFREARNQYQTLLEDCEARGWRDIVMFGAGDLLEVTLICAQGCDINIMCTVTDDESDVCPVAVVGSLEECPAFDAVVIVSLDDPQASYEHVVEHVPAERVLAPDILNISTDPKVFTRRRT